MIEHALTTGPYAGRMDAWSRTTTEMLDQLAAAMRGRVVDGITVHDADAVLDWGATGELIVRLTVVIDDTPPDREMWPLTALHAIDGLAAREADRLGIEEWVYVRRRRIGSANDRPAAAGR